MAREETEPLGLLEVAYACRLYEQLTGYDISLRRLRTVAPDGVNLLRNDHRDAVLTWLRQWGCRQFALAYNALSSAQLMEWAEAWGSQLPGLEANLVDLDERALDVCVSAYADLWMRPASYAHRGASKTLKTFGPVGAAKTMYVTRPLLFPPWDRAIIKNLGYGVGASGDFRRYLANVAGQLVGLAARADCAVDELPARLGRPHSSPPKLIDEYNWTVFAKGCTTPKRETLAAWTEWSEIDAEHGRRTNDQGQA